MLRLAELASPIRATLVVSAMNHGSSLVSEKAREFRLLSLENRRTGNANKRHVAGKALSSINPQQRGSRKGRCTWRNAPQSDSGLRSGYVPKVTWLI